MSHSGDQKGSRNRQRAARKDGHPLPVKACKHAKNDREGQHAFSTIVPDGEFRNPLVPLKTIEGDGWRLAIPDGLIAKDHKAYGYESGSIARGWIGEAPVTVIVQVTGLESGFNERVREIARHWLEHESRRIEVEGAADAARVDGVIEFDGLGAKDDRENCTTVVAKNRGRVWSLTVRTRPEDRIADAVEPIVASFVLV
jgi:hypothetical protein